MAITRFMRAALAGEPITLFGDGSMRRDFTHVDDIVRGVLAALDVERAPGFRAYNLGLGRADRSPDARRGHRRNGRGSRRASRPPPFPLGDVDATFADITRAREELGWTPRMSLREGLATVLAWVRANP